MELSHEEPQLSLYALTRVFSYHTMRVKGLVGTTCLSILIDSGSSHNFLDAGMAKRLGCVLTKMEKLKVAATNGYEIVCSEVCHGFTWKMQGQTFTADVLISALDSYDMLLVVQWLAELGNIS